MRTGWPAAILAAVAGLVVLGAATAPWVVEATTSEVGGVAVERTTAVTGAQLRPGLMMVGLLFVLGALAVGLLRGGPRRLVGVIVVVAGIGGAALSVAGLLQAGERPGTLQAAPWWALVGSALGAAAGWLARRRPDRRASLPARYDLDGADRARDPAGEWEMAVEPGTDDEER